MALLFLDGFEEYSSIADMLLMSASLPVYWATYMSAGCDVNTGTVNTPQPTGVTAKSFFSNWNSINRMSLSLKLPSVTTIIVGFALNANRSNKEICAFTSTANVTDPNDGSISNGFSFRIDANNFLFLRREDTDVTIATSASPISMGTWYYVEIKYTHSGSSGEITVRLDGVNIMSITGVSTAYSSTGISYFYFRGWEAGYFVDDMYVCDTSGTANNDFLGAVRVVSSKPTGNGALSQMTPSAGSNYDCVDDLPANTTDYVRSTATDLVDLYQMADIPASESPNQFVGVQVCARAKKVTGVNSQIQVVASDGVTQANSGSFTVSSNSSYYWIYNVFEKAPDGTSWTRSLVDNSEFGIKSK